MHERLLLASPNIYYFFCSASRFKIRAKIGHPFRHSVVQRHDSHSFGEVENLAETSRHVHRVRVTGGIELSKLGGDRLDTIRPGVLTHFRRVLACGIFYNYRLRQWDG